MQILHIIERLTLGGPSRALFGLSRHSTRHGHHHSVASLLAPDVRTAGLAAPAGLCVMGPMDNEGLDRQIRKADIIQVHFWNNPRLYEALSRDWPASRVVCWCHVAGDRPAQVLTRDIVGFPDVMLATDSHTAELPVFREAPANVTLGMIPASTDFERLIGAGRRIGTRFTVGYVGAVDFLKMHPDFAAMHAAIDVPNLRIAVCGSGADCVALARQVARLGCPDRFEFRGHVESIGAALSEFDVFGYPLHPETYATAELSLQEAMFAGVPPVVLSQGSPARIVQHGKTGLVASDAKDYARAIERLHREPVLRHELGAAAAGYAREKFGADKMALSFNSMYERAMAAPKRTRRLGAATGEGNPASRSGALRFVESLGESGSPFVVSLRDGGGRAGTAEVLEAEALIASSPPMLANGGSGGILHYRLHYPCDPHLRYWAGLVFRRQNRPALAAVEFHRAIALGLDNARVRRHLTAAADRKISGP